jgi:hypothetical protein
VKVNDIVKTKTNEELLKNISIKKDESLKNTEKELLTKFLCKHKELKVKIQNAIDNRWLYSEIFEEIVLKHLTDVDTMLNDFTNK